MEETYVPRREFHRKTDDKTPKRYPPRRTNNARQKKDTTLKLADIMLMQGIVCTLLFAIVVCVRVINTDFTVGIREKLNTAMSEQLTLDDASNLIDEGKNKFTAFQQTVKTTFGFQDELTPEIIETETDAVSGQAETKQIVDIEPVDNNAEQFVTDEMNVSETAQEVGYEKTQEDEAVIDEEVLQQINDEINGAENEKKLEPLREIMPPSEGI